MNDIVDLFFEGFLGEPSIFLGFITLVGYITLGHNISQILSGVIKTVVGFRILQTGTGLLVRNFRPILNAFVEKFGLQGVFLSPEDGGLPATTSTLEKIDIGNGSSAYS